MVFPNLNTIPENANKFASQEFSPSCSNSMAFSIQANLTAVTDADSPTFTVYGGNIDGTITNMVMVKDENGSSGPKSINEIFTKSFFPYKYIGIQYTSNTNTGAGTISFVMEQRPTKITLG